MFHTTRRRHTASRLRSYVLLACGGKIVVTQELPDVIEKYFAELEEHILSRIHDGKVGDSCFAAVMFVFATVDSLGRLMAPSSIEGCAHKRFLYCLEQYFPRQYLEKEEELWGLRNALFHNALNVATFLAAAQEIDVDYQHLEVVYSTSYLFLDTAQLHEDLCAAVMAVRDELNEDPGIAIDRSKRLEEDSVDSWDTEKVHATPFAVVWFRQL